MAKGRHNAARVYARAAFLSPDTGTGERNRSATQTMARPRRPCAIRIHAFINAPTSRALKAQAYRTEPDVSDRATLQERIPFRGGKSC